MNKLVSGALAAAVAATTLAAVPAAAEAGPKNGACEVTEVCAFKNRNYNNGMADIASHDSDWRDNLFSTSGTAHDSTSSGFGISRAHMYWGAPGYNGRWFILGLNQYDPLWKYQDITPWPNFNFNNKISSNAMYIP